MRSIGIGSDFSAILSGVKNAVSGAALTTATVTAQLYTSAGVTVGSPVSCSYVAASAGGAEDATFAGTIESTVTSGLTAGAAYYILYTVSSSGIDSVHREDLTAQSPGSTIIDGTIWAAMTGQSLTAGGADELAAELWCDAVSDALERMCYPILLAPRTLTLFPFDAPAQRRELMLPRPIRSISAIYHNAEANGDSSVLDLTADLLVANTDYLSKADDVLTGWNRSGIVLRLNRSSWGYNLVRPPTRLGYDIVDEPGSVFVSGAVGPASVSSAVRAAACSAVTLLMQRRKTGAPLNSESWGGYSYSTASQFTAESAVRSPDVLQLLNSVGALPIHVA